MPIPPSKTPSQEHLCRSTPCQVEQIQSWNEFIETLNPPNKAERIERIERIKNFLSKANVQSVNADAMSPEATTALEKFIKIRRLVFKLMVKADGLAEIIREKPKN